MSGLRRLSDARRPTGTASSATYLRGDNAWSGVIPLPGALELADIYLYGHSYPAGFGLTTPATYGYPARLSARTRANTASNRTVASTPMGNCVATMTNSGASSWTPGTKGLVIVDSVINSVINVTSANDAAQQTGFQHDLRTALRILRSSAWLLNTDASNAYTGSWNTTQTGIANTRGSVDASTTANAATVTITTTQQNICVMVLGFGGTAQATFTVTVNGVATGVTYDTSTAVTNMTGGSWNAYSIPVYGMPAGSNTVVITKASATGTLYYNGYLVMANTTPPGIIVVKDVVLTTAGFQVNGADTNRNAAGLATYNGFVDSICAETEFADGTIAVADPNPAFDNTRMLQGDLVHPNNIGHAVFADAVQSASAKFTVRTGLNSITA